MTYTLQDYLVSLHSGQWFGFDGEHTYANLVIHDDTKSKPSEADCTAGVAALQKAYDDAAYQRNRVAEYPSIGDQLDMIYHNGDGGATFQAAIKAVKDKYPKE